jgi:hypothetical protein
MYAANGTFVAPSPAQPRAAEPGLGLGLGLARQPSGPLRGPGLLQETFETGTGAGVKTTKTIKTLLTVPGGATNRFVVRAASKAVPDTVVTVACKSATPCKVTKAMLTDDGKVVGKPKVVPADARELNLA